MSNPRINAQIFELSSERLRFRIPDEKDVLQIFELRSDPIHNVDLDRPLDKTIADSVKHIDKLLLGIEEKKWINYVITRVDDDELLGLIGFFNFNETYNKAEIGYELLPVHQRQGIMTDALPFMLEFGKNYLKLKKIVAHISENNLGSKLLVKKNGFNRNDEFEDSILEEWILHFD